MHQPTQGVKHELISYLVNAYLSMPMTSSFNKNDLPIAGPLYTEKTRKGRQVNCPGRHWRRWRQAFNVKVSHPDDLYVSVYTRDPTLVITVPADVLAPYGDGPAEW